MAVETKEIAGALAGGVLAMELIETLVAKGFLTKADARGIFDNAIKAVGPGRGGVMTNDANVVRTVLESFRKGRFTENE